MLQRLSLSGGRAIMQRHSRGVRPLRAAQQRPGMAPRATTAHAQVAEVASSSSSSAQQHQQPHQPAFKANLDFKFVKENLQLVTDNARNRNTAADPARVVELYDEFSRLKQETDRLRASRNENSAAMKVIQAAIGAAGWRGGLKGGGGQKRRARRAQTARRRRRSRAHNPPPDHHETKK
jgi:hypothetical protein